MYGIKMGIKPKIWLAYVFYKINSQKKKLQYIRYKNDIEKQQG